MQSMLDMHKSLASAAGEHQSPQPPRRIEAADRQIGLLDELNNLAKEQIAIVEGK